MHVPDRPVRDGVINFYEECVCTTGVLASDASGLNMPRSLGIRIFDLAAPDKGASIVGLGLGSGVAERKASVPH